MFETLYSWEEDPRYPGGKRTLDVTSGPGVLRFTVTGPGDIGDVSVQADMTPANVNRLHSVLGAWMALNGITAQAVVPVQPLHTAPTDDRMRALIREELAALLPLYRTPEHGYVDAGGDAVDPEPKAVGHPEPGPTWDDDLWARQAPGCTCVHTDRAHMPVVGCTATALSGSSCLCKYVPSTP